MIKTKNGTVKIKGKVSGVLADLSMTVKAVKELLDKEGYPENEAAAAVRDAFEIGMMSDSQALEYVARRIGEFLKEKEENE